MQMQTENLSSNDNPEMIDTKTPLMKWYQTASDVIVTAEVRGEYVPCVTFTNERLTVTAKTVNTNIFHKKVEENYKIDSELYSEVNENDCSWSINSNGGLRIQLSKKNKSSWLSPFKNNGYRTCVNVDWAHWEDSDEEDESPNNGTPDMAEMMKNMGGGMPGMGGGMPDMAEMMKNMGGEGGMAEMMKNMGGEGGMADMMKNMGGEGGLAEMMKNMGGEGGMAEMMKNMGGEGGMAEMMKNIGGNNSEERGTMEAGEQILDQNNFDELLKKMPNIEDELNKDGSNSSEEDDDDTSEEEEDSSNEESDNEHTPLSNYQEINSEKELLDNFAGAPSEETSAEAPSEETSAEAPSEETSAEAPSEETSAEAPSEETSAEAPSVETSAEAPSVETSAEAPSEETSQCSGHCCG